MSALDSFEFRVTRALGDLQAALARETACMAFVREAIDRRADASQLRQQLNEAAKASTEAFNNWHALVVDGCKA